MILLASMHAFQFPDQLKMYRGEIHAIDTGVPFASNEKVKNKYFGNVLIKASRCIQWLDGVHHWQL